MVKGFNEAWRNSGRKESEISIRYQYQALRASSPLALCAGASQGLKTDGPFLSE